MSLNVHLLFLLALAAPRAAGAACGDCDGQPPVNVLDALAAARLATGLGAPTAAQRAHCDVDASGGIVVVDALRIAQVAVGLPVALACPRDWVEVSAQAEPPALVMGACFDGSRGRILVTPGAVDRAWEWDGMTWSRRPGLPHALGRWRPPVTYDTARSVAVVYGGAFDDDLWESTGLDWTQRISATPPPAVRASYSFVHDAARGVCVLFGGDLDTYLGTETNETWEWDGAAWTQAFPPVSPPARQDHGAVFDTTRGVTTIFGGWVGGTFLNDMWSWDGATWTEVVSPTAPSARRAPALAADDARGRLVLFGGTLGTPAYGNDGETWEWDGATWYQQSSHGPAPRTRAALVYDPLRGRTVLIGGDSSLGSQLEVWEWDGACWHQAAGERATPVIDFPALACDRARSELVMCAGSPSWAPPAFGMWIDAGTGWEALCTGTPPATRLQWMAFDEVRAMTVLFAAPAGPLGGHTWEWDGVAWSERVLAVEPPIVTLNDDSVNLVYDSSRAVTLLVGAGSSRRETWEWDGSGQWAQRGSPINRPSRIEGGGMAYDRSRGVAVLHGHPYGAGASAETWEWNGSSWSQRFPPLSPAARQHHAMAYDEARARTVLFGGLTIASPMTIASDTWEWDGSTWSQASAAGATAAMGGAMTYDPARGAVALAIASGAWEWDGSIWRLRPRGLPPQPGDKPARRSSAAMAFDTGRGVTVLQGGLQDRNARDLETTWEWDGAIWTPRTVPGPHARTRAAMAHDPVRGECLLFGGSLTSGVQAGDTWTWDGSSWTERFPPSSPPARSGASLAFDSGRAVAVLYGGFADDTWEWDGSTWSVRYPALRPPPAFQPSLAYHATRGVTLLAGLPPPAGAWTWDGIDWTPVGAAPFSWEQPSSSAFDPREDACVLVGGYTFNPWPGALGNEAWGWDGTWRRLEPLSRPAPRLGAHLTFDTWRGALVLYGGHDGGTFNDIWEY